MLLYDGPIEASIGFVFFAGSKPRLRYKLALRVFRLAARDFIDPRVPRARSSATIFFIFFYLFFHSGEIYSRCSVGGHIAQGMRRRVMDSMR